ncbi:MAG TPA: phosphatase PAP2 family protein [Gemmatimonadales bacterium]|nr:phosphatase PAP2 family protein [Gemmatimonadales bacterium]
MTARPFSLGFTALAGFVVVALTVTLGWTARLDDAVVATFAANRGPDGAAVALAITALGAPALVALVVIVAGAQFWTAGRRSAVVACALSPAVAGLTEETLKLVFGRPRPAGALIVLPGSTSFPSGHAAATAALYVILGLLVADLQTAPAARRATLVTALVLPILTAASRVYLGVHYFSDVVAGLLLGLGVALLVYGAVTRGAAAETR